MESFHLNDCNLMITKAQMSREGGPHLRTRRVVELQNLHGPLFQDVVILQHNKLGHKNGHRVFHF